MPAPSNQPASLSEISHLFLSAVRKNPGGVEPPKRIPPRKGGPSVDLTPEEFGRVIEPPAEDLPTVPSAIALLTAHFGARQMEIARQYANSLASKNIRVGLILIDSGEFFIQTFQGGAGDETHAPPLKTFDSRGIREAINELNCDLDQWIVVPLNPRLPESRRLLRLIPHWILASSADQDSLVAAYRSLKGVEEIGRPRLSIAPLTQDPAQSLAVFRRLASVAGQFLHWTPEFETLPAPDLSIKPCTLIEIASTSDKAAAASGAHWQIIEELLEQAKMSLPRASTIPAASTPETKTQDTESATASAPAENVSIAFEDSQEHEAPVMSFPKKKIPVKTTVSIPPLPPEGPKLMITQDADPYLNVIDLPESPDASDAILEAVMAANSNQWMACPIRPPFPAPARLAVSRDRRLVIVALASEGLDGLRSIGLALNWVVENKQLLAMALPQLSIDGGSPMLTLLVDRADADAELLKPLFASTIVRIQTFQRLRWGGKTGILLEAA